jgi:3-oxoacyl-[acyl-carrier protein] reductase
MLRGQIFLVTGGSRGIGKATVEVLVRSGANVAFTYRSSKEASESLCDELAGEGGQVAAFQGEAHDLEQARSIVSQVKERFGGLHGMVINAGITKDKPFYMMSEEDWDAVMQTNLKGTFAYARAVIYDFIKQKYGRIVCLSSVSGLMGVPGQANYSATKAGQIGFVQTLSKEVAKFGVTVNAVAPGFVKTEMWESIPSSVKENLLKEIPLGRVGEAAEVADAVCFLLKAGYMTGSVLVMDGGLQA